MQLWKGTSEEFLLKKGWKKVKGVKVDLEFLEPYNHLDMVYFESTEDFIAPCEYWTDGEEAAMENADEVINNFFEDHFDDQDNLYDESVAEVKPRKIDTESENYSKTGE